MLKFYSLNFIVSILQVQGITFVTCFGNISPKVYFEFFLLTTVWNLSTIFLDTSRQSWFLSSYNLRKLQTFEITEKLLCQILTVFAYDQNHPKKFAFDCISRS